uniref:Uncharacterized protein n=1 Tax=Panagrolaimus davidi TaxID=227884 RepID=A0A914PWV1_9BILA
MPREIRSETQNVAGIKDEPNESSENQPPEKDIVEENELKSELEASKLQIGKLQSKLQNLEDIAKTDAQAMEDWKSKFEELKEENFNYLKQINDMRTKNDALQKQVDDYQKRIETITARYESLAEALRNLLSATLAVKRREKRILRLKKKRRNLKEEMQRKLREGQEELDRLQQELLDKKSTEINLKIETRKLMLKNVAGYEPGQVDDVINTLNEELKDVENLQRKYAHSICGCCKSKKSRTKSSDSSDSDSD